MYDGACDGAGESERVYVSWGEVRSTDEETGPRKESSLVKPSRQRSGVSDGRARGCVPSFSNEKAMLEEVVAMEMEKELLAMVESSRWLDERR